MNLKIIDRLIYKAKTWNELYKDLSINKKYTQKFKGDVFERITQAYLLTIPAYKSILSDVWLNDEVPRRVLKKLNLPFKDFGTDLIAKTNKGEYWTIQCKFRASNSALNYKELSTFINQSFVTAKNIKLAIVAHTSVRPIKNRKFLKELSEIGADRWLELSREEWNNIRKFCNRKPVKIVKRKPRSHQKKAIVEAKNYFLIKKNSRGKLIMPCATGKSLAAFWIAQALKSQKVIVAVPSLALVKQSLNDWTKEYMANGVIPEWLCICSDYSAGKVNTDEFNTDTYDLGIPTTTDKSEIKEFLMKRTRSPKIVFTTYQSSPRLAAAAKDIKENFDLCIFDEAHKTVGVQGKRFSTLLFDKEIKIKKRIFMTATERVLRGKNDQIASMDNPKIYGDYIYVMTFKDAIDQNIISDYKIVTMLISNSEVDRLVDENYFLTTDLKKLDESSSQYLASGIALKKSFRKYKLKHAISFHRSISLAKQFQNQQDYLNSVPSLRPKVENLHISSKKSSGERTELIKEFTELDRSLITNARCLTEGVDVPAIDCVMFVDPKQSTVDIVQAAGRALRKYSSKDFGYILLPVVVPEEVDFETFLETTAFKKISSIVASLSSQDERIAEEYRLIEKGKKSSGVIIDIDPRVKIGKKIKISEFSKAIDLKIWDKVSKINWRNFEEARKFVHSLKLKNLKEWQKFAFSLQRPLDIPSHPNETYKNLGWINYGDWLGTFSISNRDKKYRDFLSARKFARSLAFASGKEWMAHCKEGLIPEDIPHKPDLVYKKNGWISWGDWLGTGTVANYYKEWLPFKEARKYVRTLKIKTGPEYYRLYKTNKFKQGIPRNPNKVYKAEWISMGDWLGTGRVADRFKVFLPYNEAKKIIHKQKLTSSKEWRKYCKSGKKPSNIPAGCQHFYRGKGWVSWSDFLGSEYISTHKRKFISYIQAKKKLSEFNIKSQKQFIEFKKSKKFPANLPRNPATVYRDKGWADWYDFLGNKKVTFRPYKEAQSYASSLNLENRNQWNLYHKKNSRPEDIPGHPHITYKNKGWMDWSNFLVNKK